MAAAFRVFLSAVTSEFGTARDGVANDLPARDLQLPVQRSFRKEPESDTLLRLLHDYIRDCSAVVCVIGTRSGACPPPAAAANFAHMLPPGISVASYTQWEFFFALAHKRRLSLYLAEPDYRRTRRPATTFRGCNRPLFGTSRPRGCTAFLSPTAISYAPRCSRSRGPRNGGPNQSSSLIRASAPCSKAGPRLSSECARV